MSASISCNDALAAIRRGEKLPAPLVRQLGEEQPADFFRIIIEGLGDSFDPREAAAYEELMTAWISPAPRARPIIPEVVESVYVLSRVTLGADIKITSVIFAALKKCFPGSAIVFVANRKCAELYAADARISHLEVEYPRSGPVSQRIEFARELSRRLKGRDRIVIDPDSRMTQLGLAPVCEPERYFHFNSRGSDCEANLTTLTQDWVKETFGQTGEAYIAPARVIGNGGAAVSFGVGENESKRIAGDFEARVIRAIGEKFQTIWIDRGAGGEEARRVIAAARDSGCLNQIRFWEGSFAGFASLISQCAFYAGYDSAGQHAAAASGVPLITFFRGAPSARFRERWRPAGAAKITVVDADAPGAEECLACLEGLLER